MAKNAASYPVNTDKIKAAVLNEAAEKAGVPVQGSSIAAICEGLTEHFLKTTAKADFVQCEDCGGLSSSKLDACPYCGMTEDDFAQKHEGAAQEPKAAKPPKEPKAATTGLVHAKAKGGKAVVIQEDPRGTVEDLDRALLDIERLKAGASVTYWQLGAKVAEIHDKVLWKTRVDAAGKAAFKTFQSFCEAEIGLSTSSAFNLMDVARNFDEAAVAQFGHSKLGLLLQAPTPTDREELEKDLKSGASYTDMRGKVREKKKAKGGPKRDTGRKKTPEGKSNLPAAKAKPAAAPAAAKITVAQIEGKKRVPLFTKDTFKKDPKKPAKRLGDRPCGLLELSNGVTQKFEVVEGAAGQLFLVVDTVRE